MRLLLLSKTTGYQARSFREASERLGVRLVLGTDRCHVLEDPWRDGAIALRFEDPAESAQRIVNAAAAQPFTGVVALGDETTLTAAMAAQDLDIVYHSPAGARAAGDKFETRRRFRDAGLPVPRFARIPADTPSPELPADIIFPCVLKPLALAAGRGVIRADDAAEFRAAFQRIRRLVNLPEIQMHRPEASRWIQAESFIEGREYALEGIMNHGKVRVLAIFDKPDPLDGPFFEETIYVTPSRLPPETQRRIHEHTERAALALGLLHGPIHAEMRVHDAGIWMLEVAARPIGGLCAKALRFSDGVSLEELLIRHALGMPTEDITREVNASGVMMIPVPADGLFAGVEGVEQARQVPHIEEILITAKPKQKLVRWPEGNSYPGFIFARADSPPKVESALREAHGCLKFVLEGSLPVL